MIIPDEVMEKFEKETDGLLFGKDSVSVFRRGGHCHYEIDKHYTLLDNDYPKDILPTERKVS